LRRKIISVSRALLSAVRDGRQRDTNAVENRLHAVGNRFEQRALTQTYVGVAAPKSFDITADDGRGESFRRDEAIGRLDTCLFVCIRSDEIEIGTRS